MYLRSLLVLGACLVFLACSKDSSPNSFNDWMKDNGKVKVLSTTAMIDDLVKEIGKDRVDHLTLIVGELDPHSYELVKGDEEKISFANIVFYNGLGLEHGASLRYSLEHLNTAVPIAKAIQTLRPEKIINVQGEIDPHLWMDVSLWIDAIGPIVERLSQVDPQGAKYYKDNGGALKEKMKQAHEQILAKLQAVPSDKRYLVTSHDAFNYFARAYLAKPDERNDSLWRKRFVAPEGLAPEGQLSTADIQRIIDQLCEYHIGVVFPESNVNRDSLKKIVNACSEKGLQVKLSKVTLYADAMGTVGSDADTYLKMLEHDSNALVQEWK